MIGRFSRPPAGLGVTDGRLVDCPSSPNCVSSHAETFDAAHFIEPLAFQGDPAAAWRRLIDVVRAESRTRIVETTDRYLRAEFATRLLRFVDDVEFLLDPDAGVIHVRSASRVGYSDLGVNRRRIEDIRRAFQS